MIGGTGQIILVGLREEECNIGGTYEYSRYEL